MLTGKPTTVIILSGAIDDYLDIVDGEGDQGVRGHQAEVEPLRLLTVAIVDDFHGNAVAPTVGAERTDWNMVQQHKVSPRL